MLMMMRYAVHWSKVNFNDDNNDNHDDDDNNLARLLVLASLPARRGVFGVDALVRPTPWGLSLIFCILYFAIVVTCSLVRDTDLEWMVERVAAFGRFAPIMFM